MWQDLFDQLFLLMFLSGIDCDVKKKKKNTLKAQTSQQLIWSNANNVN